MQSDGEGSAGLDFNQRPFIAIWEATQACDLACTHCRAGAQPFRSSSELSTSEAQKLIDQIAEMQVPVFVITGGDPIKRPDIYDLVGYATSHGVRTSLTPSATPLLTREAIAELQRRGMARLAVSLDGSTAEIHDAFRRVPGSYDCTLQAVRWARELGVSPLRAPLQRHRGRRYDGADDLRVPGRSGARLHPPGAITRNPLTLRFSPARVTVA